MVPHLPIVHYGRHGISSIKTKIKYFNKEIDTGELDKVNKAYFLSKWH